MITIKSIRKTLITEVFKNLSLDDKAEKEIWAARVWEILEKSYKAIGGVGGTGFNSQDDMVATIPFWKLRIKNGDEIVGVILYKDAAGRKAVAIGSNGKADGRKAVLGMMKDDLSRSWAELSKGALGATMRIIPWKALEKYAIDPLKVQEMMPKKDVAPVDDTFDNILLSKFPVLRPYAYTRTIGGKTEMKVAFGKPGKAIS